jgi:hypothetical protein
MRPAVLDGAARDVVPAPGFAAEAPVVCPADTAAAAGSVTARNAAPVAGVGLEVPAAGDVATATGVAGEGVVAPGVVAAGVAGVVAPGVVAQGAGAMDGPTPLVVGPAAGLIEPAAPVATLADAGISPPAPAVVVLVAWGLVVPAPGNGINATAACGIETPVPAAVTGAEAVDDAAELVPTGLGWDTGATAGCRTEAPDPDGGLDPGPGEARAEVVPPPATGVANP